MSDTVLSEREFRLRILELRFGKKGICEVQRFGIQVSSEGRINTIRLIA